MKQKDFERRHHAHWQRLQAWLRDNNRDNTRGSNNDKNRDTHQSADTAALIDLPASYRALCQQLAVAKERQYTSSLIEQLNQLVMACHQQVYRQQAVRLNVWLWYLFAGFPQALRAQAKYLWLAIGLFVLPALVLGLGSYWNDALIYAVMSPEQVLELESMYDPGNRVLGRERGSDSDLMMFGYYIKNNIGIAFRTFAAGILFGAGSIFFLVFNGIYLGAVFGHIARVGFGATFYPFVIGHGAFELTAIVFAGAAGLRLGYALISPGQQSRRQSLRIAANESMKIMYGTFLMLVIAAFLEAFWSSSSTLTVPLKLTVGAALWALVIGYCLFAGRNAPEHYRGS